MNGAEKKSKVLVVILCILILFSVFLTYKRAFIDKDFIIINSSENQ